MQISSAIFIYIFTAQAQRESHVAIVMVEFAHQLMQLLDNINRDSFQVNRFFSYKETETETWFYNKIL